MAVPMVGLSCANCGIEVTHPEARELVYGNALHLETVPTGAMTEGIATLRFAVMRPIGPAKSAAMLLCDGCMGAALQAVCRSILADMEALSSRPPASVS